MTDTHFRIRLGRIITPDGHEKFIRLARHIRRSARRVGRSGGHTRRNAKSQAAQYFQRRVIVKFHLVKMNAQGAARQARHLEYIARDSAAKDHEHENETDIKKCHLFDRDGKDADIDAFKERGANDPHQFRIIVSPEDSLRMADLDGFTRNVMRQMEDTLGTRLDWVAASHYDTATPHVHIVLRGVKDNGQKLIIPRRLISYGMREQCERLVSLELGPMNVLEAGEKLARQVTQERFTALDRSLVTIAEDNIVDVGSTPKQGEAWTRRLDIARLKYLSRMGLAQKQSAYRWKLADNIEQTLRELGERGDIIKARHKALKRAGLEHKAATWGDIKYMDHMGQVTGRVLSAGVRDDVNDRAYVVLDTIGGEQLYVDIGKNANIDGIARDNIVQVSPLEQKSKQADKVIADIAARNGGLYSADIHARHDPTARPDYIQAHIRRLEAMRRVGLTKRYQNGNWQIPGDHMDRAVQYEAKRQYGNRVRLQTLSRMGLDKMTTAIGRTWLDKDLQAGQEYPDAKGFGQSVRKAQSARRQYLVRQGILTKKTAAITEQHLEELERRDLANTGKKLSRELGKPYEERPDFGRVSGTYTKSVETVSGKYAILERSHEFTLVPWRETLERQRGRSISAQIRGQTINWQFGRKRGLEIS